MIKSQIKPFLKWAGGKRWFVFQHLSTLPSIYNRYIEPFLGSGAVFFTLGPKRAILSDINKDLIDSYMAIKTDWKQVFNILKKHHRNHSKEYYYKIRSSNPRTLYPRAARLIYLNRTCWNGLYRVNLKGEFNVPIGTKKDVIMETDNFAEISRLLRTAKLENRDFEFIINQATEHDLLFVDPPYTVTHYNNGFIKYNEKLFSWDDQIRLCSSLKQAKERGAKIVLTNACHHHIRKLYQEEFKVDTVYRSSVLAADPAKRKRSRELIIQG